MSIYPRLFVKLLAKRFKLKNYYFTSESVSRGHPDKVCDQISDMILDEFLRHDPKARVAVETFAAPNNLIVGGEISTSHHISAEDIEEKIRLKIKEIGYAKDPFHWKNVKITNLIHEQSQEIAAGVIGGTDKEEGAGDQGMMFGYACSETDALMPAAIHYSHKIIQNVMDFEKNPELKGLGPDGKTQLTLQYDKNNKPVRATSIVLSVQHPAKLSQKEIRSMVLPVIERTLPKNWMCEPDLVLVNPTGSFIVGGPQADTGLTGRKIIVDTYGGAAPHGGGAFSGKDPSKVDRSAAYAARYLAKNIVAAGLAERCLIQISYAIGVARPLSIYLNTYGTSHAQERKIVHAINKAMDLSPRGIRNHLHLDRPIYEATAAYGHFGREATADGHFSWERLDLVDELRAYVRSAK